MPATMPRISSGRANRKIPGWAVMERDLISLMNCSVDILLERYLTPEGRILWPESVPGFQTYAYSNVDNAFEGFASWPLFYLLGGDERFLKLGERQYDVLIDQFTNTRKENLGIPLDQARTMGREGMIVDEWFPDLDWMHMGEAAMFFYYLNLANPSRPENRARSQKYAQYMIGENPAGFEANYDPVHRVFKSCYFGTNGPAYEKFRRPVAHSNWMNPYGLAFYDVPGVVTMMDLADPEKAERYGRVYGRRLMRADTVTNLMSTSMILNAYMHSGEPAYREWILSYIGGWRERYFENAGKSGGAMPDNAGSNGIVGETIDGKWYGGHYGWVHPHGFFFIGDSLVIAGENERLLTGASGRLNWVGEQLTMLMKYAQSDARGTLLLPQKRTDEGTILEYGGQSDEIMTRPDRVTGYEGFVRRRQVDGFYEFSAAHMTHPAHLYYDSFGCEQAALARELSRAEVWGQVSQSAVMSKYKGGQDAAYLNFLTGGYPRYPEEALMFAINQVYGQLAILNDELSGSSSGFGYAPDGQKELNELAAITEELNRRYDLNFSQSTTHSYYQTFLLYRNPVTTEALVHLTMGGFMPIYNGGLMQVSIRHFDPDNNRPGLPPDVAVLVERVGADFIDLTACNLHLSQPRRLIIQAGAYGEHQFTYARTEGGTTAVDGRWLELFIEPGARIDLTLGLNRNVHQPSYAQPHEW